MEEEFEVANALVDCPVYDGAGDAAVGFIYGTATANPWSSSLYGLDSSDRVVDVRGPDTNYYRDVAAMRRIDTPPQTTVDVASHLELVPYVHPSASNGYNTVEANAAVGGNEVYGPTTIVLDEDPSDDGATSGDDVGNTNRFGSQNEQWQLRTKTWDGKLKELESMAGCFRGMKDYAAKLEEALYNIALVSCMDTVAMGSVGYLIPTEIYDVARGSSCVPGVRMPNELRVQFDAIGITCQEKYNCRFGDGSGAAVSIKSCGNPACSQNRYPSPNVDSVWAFTRWIETGATDADLSMCWYTPGVPGVRALTGHDVKSFIQGNDYGVEMLAALINLLRALEGSACNVGDGIRTRHYVDHEWANMVSTGLLREHASSKQIFAANPAYNITSSSTVIVPLCVQNNWSCYTFDFHDRVVTIMDPNIEIVTSNDFAFHQKNANILLMECVRCMRALCGDNTAGTGQWNGKMLMPRHMQNSLLPRTHSLIKLMSCMMGFNDDYVCHTDDEMCNSWMRRKMAYSLMQIAGTGGNETMEGRKGEGIADTDRGSETGGMSY